MAHRPGERSFLEAMWTEVPHTHLFTVSAAMAYYGLFGLLPALAAAAALLGQLGGFDALRQSVDQNGALLPMGTAEILRQFVTGIPERFGGGFGLLLNVAIVVFVAFRAASGLLTALNIVYDVEEKRSDLKRAWLALVVGVCGIVFLFTALLVLTLPPLLAAHAPDWLGPADWLRWPALAVTFAAGLALLFAYGPARETRRWGRVALGAICATSLWILASAGVSIYAAHLASYGRIYGSLGSVALVLVWFYMGAFAVLLGAQTDAVLCAMDTGKQPSRLHADLRRRAKAG